MPASHKPRYPRSAAMVAALRRTAGLQQLHLAEATGIHRTTINLYERGERRPTGPHWRKIEKACGLTRIELAGRLLEFAGVTAKTSDINSNKEET